MLLVVVVFVTRSDALVPSSFSLLVAIFLLIVMLFVTRSNALVPSSFLLLVAIGS